MYKVDFLKALTDKISNMSAEELSSFILKFAETMPSENYLKVLSLLEDITEINQSVVTPDVELTTEINEISTEIDEIFAEIADNLYEFSWHFDDNDYYDYHDDYTDESEEELVDENGLSKRLSDLFEKVIKLGDNGFYEDAYHLFERLMSVEIASEYETVTVMHLFEYDLMKLSYEKALCYHVHSAIRHLTKTLRAEAVYKLITYNEFYSLKNFTIDAILKCMNTPVPDIEEFYTEWIDFLSNLDSGNHRLRDELLIDALTSSGGINALQQFVENEGMSYPEVVFKKVRLDIENENFDSGVETIRKGFDELEGLVCEKRKRLADYLLVIAKAVDCQDYFKEGTIEGFKSSLRLSYYAEIHQWQDVELVQEMLIFLEANVAEKDFDYFGIQFLNGQCEEMWRTCLKDKNVLGWSDYGHFSGSLKGQLFPLLLALLTKGDLGKVTARLVDEKARQVGVSNFSELVSTVERNLSQQTYNEYLKWCQSQIKSRMDEIIGKQRRSSYGKVSALIVAMGEVLASNEGLLVGNEYIRVMKSAYSRHNSFQRCVKEDLTRSSFGS